MRLSFAGTVHPLPCYASRISDGRSTMVYGADGAYSEELVAHASGVDLLLLEATYVDDGPEVRRHGHLTGEQAGNVALRAGVGRLVRTHTGPRPEHNADNLRRAAHASPARSNRPARAPFTPRRHAAGTSTPMTTRPRSWRR